VKGTIFIQIKWNNHDPQQLQQYLDVHFSQRPDLPKWSAAFIKLLFCRLL